MNKVKRYCLILSICIFGLTGCQSPFKSSSKSSQSSASQNNKKNITQNTSNNSNSNNNTGFSQVPGAIVNPGSFSSAIKSSLVFQSGNILYYANWSDGDKIYKMNLNGSGSQKISDDSAAELIISNNIIYYSNESNSNKLYSVNIDGTGKKKLLDESVNNLELMGNLIYYIDSNNNVSTFDTTSSAKVPLNVKSRCFDSDGTYIYYEDYVANNVLSSIKVDGSNYGKVYDDAPTFIAAQSGVVYYVNGYDGNKIYKISSDGSNRTKLNDSEASNLIIDSGWIYYINNSDFDKIYKIKLDGSNNTKVSDESFVRYFSVAGNYIFFDKKTDINHSIYKTNK